MTDIEARVTDTPNTRVPRPGLCPACGLAADNAVVIRNELVAVATYIDTAGHIFSVTWLEEVA